MRGIPNMHALSENGINEYKMDKKSVLVLIDLGIVLVVLAIGLLKYGWGNSQLCGLFILMSVVAAVICGWSGQKYVDKFVNGVKGMAWGALIAGLSAAILVVMNDAVITDTIINF